MVKIATLVGHIAHTAAFRFYKHMGPVQMGLWVTVHDPIKLTKHIDIHVHLTYLG